MNRSRAKVNEEGSRTELLATKDHKEHESRKGNVSREKAQKWENEFEQESGRDKARIKPRNIRNTRKGNPQIFSLRQQPPWSARDMSPLFLTLIWESMTVERKSKSAKSEDACPEEGIFNREIYEIREQDWSDFPVFRG